MLELVRKYDEAIEKLQPNRTYFFECYRHGSYYKQDWVSLVFRNIWRNISISNAIPYDIRHHYAIVNINSYTESGLDFHSKFVYLSRSMGHKSLESTKYYYSLVPGLADVMDSLTSETMNQILPDINDEEKQ
jgi:integrase